MPTLETHNGYYLWQYVPSLAAAVIFILAFLIMTVLHFFKMFKTGSKFCWPFSLGVLFELVGYVGRAWARNNTGELMPYIIQSLFILVGPALLAASIYMTLGRIMRCVNAEHHSLIRVSRLTKTFVLGDVLAFVIQGGSAGLMFKPSTVQMGEDLVIAGLFIQIISFSLFFVCAIVFERRLRSAPTDHSIHSTAPWKQVLYMLYAVSLLILARSIFRVVEYIQGNSGYSLGHEWTLYTFDSVPMLITSIIFFMYYPSRLREGGMPSVPMQSSTGGWRQEV